jgi:CRP/FNR family cyclic AMP-dependent transcriptional regulator
MNLNDLPDTQRSEVLAQSRSRKLARGETLYTSEDRAEGVHFVIGGRVKIVRTSASGSEAIIGIRNAGDIFGELTWMTDERRRAASAIGIEASEVATIAAAAFEKLLRSDAIIAHAFARGIARRLTSAEQELTELAGKSVPGRLVDVLGKLAGEHGVEEADGTLRIALNLTHKDLADLIGTSRETLTKELSVLADVGLLRVAQRTITLVQPRAFPFARKRE